MALEALTDLIRGSTIELVRGLKAGQDLPALGLRRAARLPVLAAVYQELQRPVLLLTDRADRALSLAEELALWAADANRLLFPEPTPLFYENAAWGEGTRHDRLIALTTLAAYHIPGVAQPDKPPLLIAPARALMTRTMPRREFLKASRTLRQGQLVSIDELIRGWLGLGYDLVSMVISPGQFARRGGILDLWPTADPFPTRIEFFGDEVETFRRFDPATQTTFKHKGLERQENANLDRILVTPAREYLASRWSGDPEASEAGDLSEFHLPLLHEMPASLLDYLPRGTIIAFDNLQAFQDLVIEVEEQAVDMRRDYIADGILAEDFPVPYLSWSEVNDALHAHYLLELGFTTRPETEPDQHPVLQIAERFTPGPRFGGRLKPLMEYMGEQYLAGEQQLVVSRQSARLQELWAEMSLPSDPASPAPEYIEDSLSEGWSFSPELGRTIHLLTDGEIFGWRRPEPRRRHRPVAEAPEAAYADLETGDWIVHVDHGIGRFAGLVRRTVEGVDREYLCIEYADQAQLFVPIHQVDRLTRYVGPDNRMPTLSRLGGGEWRSTKAQVKESVEAVAEDLLELYAKRSVVSGHAFSPDTPWQNELEASFPYIETDDQMRVLAEVKQDMEVPRPMDRLICGDVGYGKTEVALRAAFKAVMDGRQVALLVPTTVLAQQHFNTFQQRLAAFPIRVEMLSRFRTHQQQKRIVQQSAQGAIDILIGTHRLFSSDVEFKDLGLLIIDEEQRFGVTHKEALKQLRTEVDVLTLTATPIPRTLYMALSGVRDISTINTPPEERLPIVTHVGPYSPRLVRQAILREMERGGQVFFVHNRVQTIGAMRNHLEKLVPEARVAIAHGQMPENVLSERMEQFTAGDVDVLLSTSIIESGLDIPNANTLIVDRADTFGLAQLYQLRGRVGRGALRAYAYFFRHNKKSPTYEGSQRLETIAENTQLGAGFSIAMRDLEIRGTGDILGTRQHGHIASVGFHMYTRILAAAVRQLRNDRQLPETDLELELMGQVINVNVDLPQPVSIPASYVADKDVRLGLYRRMADIGAREEVDALAEEFNDRFGPLPEAVNHLLYQLKVKLLAEQAGLSSVTVEAGQLVLRFPAGEPPSNLPDLGPSVRLGKVALWIPLAPLEDWPAELESILEKLTDYRKKAIHEALPAGHPGL